MSWLAQFLDVSTESLDRLDVGWLSAQEINDQGTRSVAGAWSFPMRDHAGRVCGVRLRSISGKFALTGSKQGLFIPRGIEGGTDQLLVAEGESDTAALLDLGFRTIGKPGAGNADDVLAHFLLSTRPSDIVVVADNDDVGIRRARRLGRRLAADHACVRVIAPPQEHKDARAWKIGGADASAVAKAISGAEPIRLAVTSMRVGR
jgi:DNA primase